MIIEISNDDKGYHKIVDEEIEHKAGEFLYRVDEKCQYVKFTLTENYGGSGIYVSKVFVFGK
jgi:hypothetical protein